MLIIFNKLNFLFLLKLNKQKLIKRYNLIKTQIINIFRFEKILLKKLNLNKFIKTYDF